MSKDGEIDLLTGEAVLGRLMLARYRDIPWIRLVLRSAELINEFTFEDIQAEDRFECIARVWLEDAWPPHMIFAVDKPKRYFSRRMRLPRNREFVRRYLRHSCLSVEVKTRVLIGMYAYQKDLEMVQIVIQEFIERYNDAYDLWVFLNVLIFDESKGSHDLVEEKIEKLDGHFYADYLRFLRSETQEESDSRKEMLLSRDDVPPYLRERIEDSEGYGVSVLLDRWDSVSDMKSYIDKHRDWYGWIMANLEFERVMRVMRLWRKIRYPLANRQ